MTMVARRRLRASVWSACQQSCNEIAGWKYGEKHQILGLEVPGFGAPIESLVSVNLSGLHAAILWLLDLVTVRGRSRHSFVFSGSLQYCAAIRIGVWDG